jgi:NAD+ synthase
VSIDSGKNVAAVHPWLALDAAAECERIVAFIRAGVGGTLHRRGAVVGVSGGIDSAVVLALCARALGPERVVAVLMPERESSPESVHLAQGLAQGLGVEAVVEDITAALDGAGCYRRRDEAVSRVVPAFGPGWKSKITLPSLLEAETLSVFEFLQIMAASNFKQRTRMATLYYQAELRSYAVVGTANQNEHALGFFVKHGDGGVDLSPIGHLFKSQVYALAEQLSIPDEIRTRPPTSDTYSAGSTQEEFFFRVPFGVLDAVWGGHARGVPAVAIAGELGLEVELVQRVIADVERKKRTTEYLRRPPLTLAAVESEGVTAA